MVIKQVYQLVNEMAKEILGEEAIVKEDLSNIVDIGESMISSTSTDAVFHSLVDHIGRMKFVDRVYQGGAPDILMESWEYGGILQKVSSKMPVAVENESWSLVDGQSYDPFVFHSAPITCKFFSKKVTFEVDNSVTEYQIKSAFSDAGQFSAFASMLFTEVENAMTVAIDNLKMRTINNAIVETIYDEFVAANPGSNSKVKAVNLLYLWNQAHSQNTLTAANCLQNADFNRFAAFTIGLYPARLARVNKLYNIGETEKFTPAARLKTVYLDQFKKAVGTYLYSAASQFNNENIVLPDGETVAFWQGPGTSYAFSDISQIKTKTSSGHDITVSGVLAVMFDREALGVYQENRKTTTQYNPKADFTNYFHKYFCGAFNDLNEQCVVFYVQDAPAADA